MTILSTTASELPTTWIWTSSNRQEFCWIAMQKAIPKRRADLYGNAPSSVSTKNAGIYLTACA